MSYPLDRPLLSHNGWSQVLKKGLFSDQFLRGGQISHTNKHRWGACYFMTIFSLPHQGSKKQLCIEIHTGLSAY